MKKFIKRFFKWTGIVIAFLIVLMIILPFIFKKQIVQAVKDEINKSVNAKVDFKDYGLTLFRSFPNFSLSLDKLSVVGINEFKDDTLAIVDELYVSLNLFSVIKGDNYTIRKIRLDKPHIHLKVLYGGKANWDIAKPSTETTKTTQPAQPSKFKLSLKKLEINDANIVYEDYNSNMFATVTGLNHTLSGDLSADLTELDTKTDIKELSFKYGGINYFKKAKISIKADLEADLKNSKYTFKDNEFGINELFFGFDGWLAMPKEGYDMDMKFSAKKTDFKNFLSLIPGAYMKDFANIKTSGKLGFDGFVKGKYTDKTLPAFALNLSIDNGMFQYPSLPKSVTNIFITASVSNKGGSADNTIIDVKKLHLEMGGVPVDARLYVSTPVSDPQIDASVKGKIDLGKVKDFYPLESDQQLSGLFTADISLKGRMSYVDKKEYEKFDAKGNLIVENFNYKSKDFAQGVSISRTELRFNPQELDLVSFAARTGRSDLNAKGTIQNYLAYFFRKELLKGDFVFTSSLLDLNSFMSSDAGTTTTTKPASTESSSMSVIELPGNIEFALSTTIGKIIYDKMEITAISGGLTLKDHIAVMKDLKMNLLGGSMVLGGSYGTVNPLVPNINLSLDVRDFDIQQTVKNLPSLGKFAPIAQKTTGRFSGKLTYASDLKKDMTPEFSTVNSAGTIQTKGIKIANADFLNKLSDELKINLLRSLNPGDLSITFKIVNGMLVVNPFDLKFSKSILNTEGTLNLDESINFVMKFTLPRSEFGGQANSVLNNLVSKAAAKGINTKPGESVSMDILATGTLTKPVFKIGLKGMMDNLKQDAENEAKQVLEQKKQEAINEAKNKANQAITDADKKAQQLIADAAVKAQQIRDAAKAAGDKVISEADVQGQKLVSDAKNPFAKEAAKVAAKNLKDQAQKKANQLNSEADKQATDLVNNAKAQADKLRNDAKSKVN